MLWAKGSAHVVCNALGAGTISYQPCSQLRCLTAVTVAVTGERTQAFLLRVMGDFNKYNPAQGQAVGRLNSRGSALLRLRGKHGAGQAAAASAELARPAQQTMPHVLVIFKQIGLLIKLNSLFTIHIFLSFFWILLFK